MRLPISTYDLADPASTADLVNCFVESLPEDSPYPYILRRSPGLRRLVRNPAGGGSSGSLANGARIVGLGYHPTETTVIYAYLSGPATFPAESVFFSTKAYLGNGEYELGGSGGSFSLAGTTSLAPGEYVDIAVGTSGDFVGLSEPDAISFASSAATVWTGTQINDVDYTSRGGGGVEFLDNYFLFREPGTGRFFSADVGSSSAFTSTNFATAETSPDALLGIKSDKAQLLLYGQSSIELWDTLGGSGFPFRKMINGTIEKGTLSGRSIQLIDNRLFWIADDKTVMTLQGMQPVKISNPAIERVMEKDPAIFSATSLAWEFEGHSYYAWRTAQNCFVYDLMTGQWHRRKTYGKQSWDVEHSVQTDKGPLFGYRITDSLSTDGTLGDMSSDIHHEIMDYASDGTVFETRPQEMEWTYQPVWGDGQRVFHDRLEIVLETGVGTDDSPDPVCQLEASDDGGLTWISLPNRSIGGVGERLQRLVWHNLGSAYQRVYKARVVESIPVTVRDTLLQAKGGRV